MKRALKSLLQRLEAIEEEHDGLGDTNVRDHMGDHVFRGLLRPEPGYQPTGEYGLDPEANRKVAAALAAFCKAAEAEARRLGLTTFEQRVAALQNPQVVTSGGSDFNDFFGVIELGQRQEVAQRATVRPVRRAYVFDRPGSLDDLLEALDWLGTWSWQAAGGGAEDTHLEATPEAGVRLVVREGLETMEADGSVLPPEHGFMALVEAGPDRIDHIDAAFRMQWYKRRLRMSRRNRPTGGDRRTRRCRCNDECQAPSK